MNFAIKSFTYMVLVLVSAASAHAGIQANRTSHTHSQASVATVQGASQSGTNNGAQLRLLQAQLQAQPPSHDPTLAPDATQPVEAVTTQPAPLPAPVVQVLVAPAPRPPAPQPPPLVIGFTQQALINQDRAAAGLAPLNWSGCLAGISAGQAQAMAAAGTIFHGNGVQQDLGCRLGSSQTGENIGEWGVGINDAGINQLFMASAGHRANILGPYHWVGTAWVVSGGKGFIAVEFA